VRRNGYLNFLLRLEHLRTYSLQGPVNFSTSGTSLSDNNTFNDFCATAASSDLIFRNFRRYKPLIQVLDHVGIEHARRYLEYVRDQGYSMQGLLPTLRIMDSIGSPRRFWFRDIGLVSPTVTRYLKVYVEMRRIFGNLDGLVISEIGVGFGGQAFLINQLARPSKYFLFDLPSTMSLAMKYLRCLHSHGDFERVDGRAPKTVSSDLVISNYALSELTKEVQAMYLENVISKATMGYVTWNLLSEKILDGFRLDEVLSLIPGSKCIPEVPHTSPGNVIIIWNR
jgi:putative sugar O-methyltransferase